jgi:hypothetical protein
VATAQGKEGRVMCSGTQAVPAFLAGDSTILLHSLRFCIARHMRPSYRLDILCSNSVSVILLHGSFLDMWLTFDMFLMWPGTPVCFMSRMFA